MTIRTKNNLKIFAFFAILLVLAILAVQAIWVGMNFMAFRIDAIEYGVDVTEARNAFYNSENLFINWLSNMTNDFIRVPVLLLFAFSPVLFFNIVKKHNMSKKQRARVY